METIPHHPLLQITEQDIKKVRENYGVDNVKSVRDSLNAVEDWCRKQDHLTEGFQYLRPDMLERLWILSRCSTEMTKIKIDKLFTMRGMMPDICQNKYIEEFDKFFEYINYVPLPKLNPVDNSRVMVTQVIDGKWDDFNLLSYMRYCFLIGEYRLNYDYSLADRFVIDLSQIRVNVFTKINPILLKRAEILCTEGFGTKINGIHFLNAPPFVDKLVSIIKQCLKEKVASRLHVHDTYEDLQKHIAKEILPKEYGGDSPSCDDLAKQWSDTLRKEEAKKIIEDSDKLVSDESKRSSTKFNEEYLGIPGSFRVLAVD